MCIDIHVEICQLSHPSVFESLILTSSAETHAQRNFCRPAGPSGWTALDQPSRTKKSGPMLSTRRMGRCCKISNFATMVGGTILTVILTNDGCFNGSIANGPPGLGVACLCKRSHWLETADRHFWTTTTLSENVGLEDCVFFFFVGHASATIPRGWLNSFACEVTEYAY